MVNLESYLKSPSGSAFVSKTMMDRKGNNPRAVILLSGGLDSTTMLAMAGSQGFDCYCLSFDYGQRQKIELELARSNAEKMGAVEHLVLPVGLDMIGGSALTDEIEVPKKRDLVTKEPVIPATYVPARNTIFLSLALAWAEVIGARDIFIGVNALDYSGYPDCRPEYIKAFSELARLATRTGIAEGGSFNIQAPLINLSKKEIIEKGLALGVDYAETHSCYDPVWQDNASLACGECDACYLRLKGFTEAGLKDPLKYK